MSHNLRKNALLLKLLSKATPVASKAILKTGDRDLINALCECSLNVLKGNVPLTCRQKKRLSRYKSTLRELANRKYSVKKKRQALMQKGGFLQYLIEPVVAAIGDILR